MGDELQLFTKGDTEGEYVEYTAPEPPAFIETIPEELKEGIGKEFRTASELAKGYADLKSAQPVIPESPDKYEMPDIPEGQTFDEKAATEFKGLAHKMGLTNDQMKAIVAFDLNRAAQYDKDFDAEIATEKETAENALKDRWGTNYEAGREKANKAFAMVINALKDGPQVKEKLDQLGLLNIPEVLVVFEMIGSKISEDVFKQGQAPLIDGDIPRGKDGMPMLDYSTTQ